MKHGPLAEIAYVISGFAFKSEWFGSGLDKIIRIGDLQNGIIENENVILVDAKKYNVSSNFKIKKNDILMALSGATTGKIAVAKDKDVGSYINQRVAIIRGKTFENASYLRHIFNGELLKKLLVNAEGAAQANLSPKDLANLQIPIPPLAEQQRIAALLDTADHILKQRESVIIKLDQLAQSLFFQIDQTTSKHFKLSDISKIVSGATPKTEIKEYWNGNIHWATPAELGKLNDIFINQTARRITNKGLASCTATLLPIHSVLFSSRAPIGHIAINSVPMATNQGFKSFVVDKQLVQPLYLYYWFNQNKLLLQSMGVGATFKELSKNIISDVKIKLPSINDQNKFVNQVNNIRDLKIKNLRAIKEIRNLISSLQHQSFTVN